jgi:hypothetical protein
VSLTPYPIWYTPAGVAKPACCPHAGGLPVIVPGPDGATGGTLWGANALPAGDWRRAAPGWWVLADGHLPQHLARLDGHPRIPRWAVVEGTEVDHFWRVPILLEKVDSTWRSSLDRVWTGDGFAPPKDLEPISRQVLAITSGVPLHHDIEERNRLCAVLAVDLLALGQWVDGDLLAALGWLSEDMMERVILAACGVAERVG